jgi:hypothetical protein
MRTFLVGLGVIAAFGIAVAAGILLATAPRSSLSVAARPGPGAPAKVDPALAPTGLSLQEAFRAAAPAPQQPKPVPLGEVTPAKVAPPPGSWEAVPVVARPAALGPVGAAVGRGLNNLSDELAACFDEETQARFGASPVSHVRDAETMNDAGTTVLVLEIESGSRTARIVDAPVETRGGASDGLIACAQHVLRGKSFEVQEAVRHQRHRVLFPLQQ